MTPPQALTLRAVFMQSWPIILANAAAPLVGLVDTFVIGRYADTLALAAIGLGAVIYNIFYWGFGFLRMSTAGLTAQADGAQDETAVQAHLFRALPLGLVIGLAILILQSVILAGLFRLYKAAPDVEGLAALYLQIRLWGLPATLGSIALMGWFVGISKSGRALQMQIVLNLVNAALSLFFVISLGKGISGVALASAIAEWAGFGAGLFLAYLEMTRRGGVRRAALDKTTLTDAAALSRLGITNSNIFIRTVCLVFGMNFFTNAAAMQGTVFLAANHILMQFITMTALVLDGFAHTAEATAGAAYGARSRERFDRAVQLTSGFSFVFAGLASVIILTSGAFVIALLTPDPAVRAMAGDYLPYCALVPMAGFAAWQLDGIFIGVTHTKEMRNASIAALLIYLAVHAVLAPWLGGPGIWIAFLIYYGARAGTLGVYYPKIRQSLPPQQPI